MTSKEEKNKQIKGENKELIGLKVIGASFGRTGTTSMKVALNKLGFPCYHMSEVFGNKGHVDLWYRTKTTSNRYWNLLFQNYSSTVDWPSTSFFFELIEEYPDAKIVLTTRDPEKWYESCLQTIFNFRKESYGFPSRLFFTIMGFNPFLRMINSLIWEGTFYNEFLNKEKAIEIYNKHVEEVKKVVPADRLLVFSVQEGWAPLCRFLDVPIPEEEPFPHANDAAVFQKRINFFRRLDRVVYSLLFLSSAAAFFFYSKKKQLI